MAGVACKTNLLLTSSNEVEWTIYGVCTLVWNSVSEPVGKNGCLNALFININITTTNVVKFAVKTNMILLSQIRHRVQDIA